MTSERPGIVAILAQRAGASPVVTFFALAYLLTWALLPFTTLSLAFSLLALCGPAVAAVLTAAPSGSAALGDLRRRVTHWRVAPRLYLLALFLPLPISPRSGVEHLMGARGPIELQPIQSARPVVFVLVAGEEIGCWSNVAA